MARQDFRKRHRKNRKGARSADTDAAEPRHEEVEELLDESEYEDEAEAESEVEVYEEEPVTSASARQSHALLGVLGFTSLLLGLASGILPILGDSTAAILETATTFGIGPLPLLGLGAVFLVGRRVLLRIEDVDERVGTEMQGLADVSDRIHSMFAGLEGFQERLEAIRSDRVAATLNQIRYEVSAMHEKVHRELFPTTEMQPVLAEISGSVGRVLEIMDSSDDSSHQEAQQALANGFDGLRERLDHLEHRIAEWAKAADSSAAQIDSVEIHGICSSMQDTLQRLSPGIESLQSAVEASVSSSDRGLQEIASLVQKVESEIRDLDQKADQILVVSNEVSEQTAEAVSAAMARSAAAPTPRSSAAPSTPRQPAGEPVAAPEEDPVATSAEDDSGGGGSTFLSAVERLKNLRGD